MFIKITRGTYGYVRPGSNLITPKDTTSEPFEVQDTEAKRLFALGVAEAVKPEATPNTPPADPPKDDKPADPPGDNNPQDPPQDGDDGSGQQDPPADPPGDDKPAGSGNAGTAFTLSALERVNKAAQENLARRRGVDLTGTTNARQRAKRIWDDIQAKKSGYVPQSIEEVEALADDADGDAPPELSAGAPVV